MTKTKKILIAEDVGLFMELEESLFQRDNIDILIAQSGLQALDMIRQEHPDLVLLDLNMPDMDGDECCRRIKKDPEIWNTPVVIMSHANWKDDLYRARKAGSDDIILKPVNREHFLKTVRELLHIADRRAIRVSARLSVHYGRLTDDVTRGYTVDISIGGSFIESTNIYPEGTPLSIHLFLPGDEKEVKCRGKVAWVNHPDKLAKPLFPPGMGIQFEDLNPEYRDYISAYVDSVHTSQE